MPKIVSHVLPVVVAASLLALAGCGSSTVRAAVKADKDRKSAPDFALKDADGKTVHLSEYKGKVVLLDFWATWCAPCKVEIPWLIKLREQYAAQGLEVIGASTDELDQDDKAAFAKDKADIANFATKMHINYPVLINGQSVSAPYGGLDALPTTFYIDRKGTIVASGIGLTDRDEIEANIKKALGGE